MKNKNTVMVIVLAILVIAGIVMALLLNGGHSQNVSEPDTASKPSPEATAAPDRPAYFFEYNGVKMGIDDLSEPILKALGEPMHYFEAPSCAFQGMDKIYSYNGFEFQTYTEDGKDYIYSIHFLDDSVTTYEGIGLNASLEDIVDAYGSNYVQSFNQYTYTKGECNLSFILENNEVVSVEYVKADAS